MADSDDEYDRKRRDKFRGERSTGEAFRPERRDERRPVGGPAGGREEWPERNPFRGGAGPAGTGGAGRPPRAEFRDYRPPRERFGSPGREMPPAKRMRGDWGDEMRGNPRFGGYDPYLMHAWNEHYAHSLHSAYAHASHAAVVRENSGMGGGGGGGVGGGSDTQTQPAMMTLKQFLDTQDDSISDSEVLRKYTEYKTEFKRQQLNEFFVAHKDEEWFKQKYHPEESIKRKDEQLNFLQKRTEVFSELLNEGLVASVKVDSNQSDPLIRLLDIVVIKLEGGTEEDLKILDEKPKEFSSSYTINERKSESERTTKPLDKTTKDDIIITSVDGKKSVTKMTTKSGTKKLDDDEYDDAVAPVVVSPQQCHVSNDENWDSDDGDMKPMEEATLITTSSEKMKKKKKKTRKRHSSDSSPSSNSDSESSSSSSEDSEEEDDDEDEEQLKKKYDLSVDGGGGDGDSVVEDEEQKVVKNVEEKHEIEKNGIENENEESEDVVMDDISNQEKKDHDEVKDVIDEDSISNAANDVDDDKQSNDDEIKIKNEEKVKDDVDDGSSIKEIKNENDNRVDDDGDESKKDTKGEEDQQPETIDLDKVKDAVQPRALHRTSSIFLRNLAPAITKSEIENICKRFDGYLRVAIADPLVERRWYRRGWITFQRDVNIKEICWNLNNQRLRDCEMGAIVNRDLSRRVRPVNGITAHKNIVRADITLCSKIAMNLDGRFKLWNNNKSKNSTQASSKHQNDGDDDDDDDSNDGRNGSSSDVKAHGIDSRYGFKTNNPVLQNIADYLIEEASAEEEELLGISSDKDVDGEALERDEQLIAVLDRLVLYLRIVHSVDYYNHCEYPYEDEMPNRCGIIHARGPPPSKASANDVQEYIKTFEGKLSQFLSKITLLNDEDIKDLGSKDSETEVEKFIQANTQELAKDKWLCPLSGKKFKGPEFIRKHIFNKHMEKVDEVKKEVEFFNNYLRDPKRPQLPEHPGSNKRTNSESSNVGGGGFRGPMFPPAFAAPPYGFGPMMMGGGGRGRGGGGGGFGGGGRRELPLEHQRRIIGYHDLDAPTNFDMFD